jgi:hypothetical protein
MKVPNTRLAGRTSGEKRSKNGTGRASTKNKKTFSERERFFVFYLDCILYCLNSFSEQRTK